MTKLGLEEERNYNARTGGREKMTKRGLEEEGNDKAQTGGREK